MVYPPRERDDDTIDIRNIREMIEWDHDFFNTWSELMKKLYGKPLEENE